MPTARVERTLAYSGRRNYAVICETSNTRSKIRNTEEREHPYTDLLHEGTQSKI